MSTTAMRSSNSLFRTTGLVAGLLAFFSVAEAQLVVGPQTNLQQLAEAISGPGVQISNPTITCHAEGYGEFGYTGSLLGLESGVVLSSGRIVEAIGPNNVENKTFQQGTSGNSILNIVTGRTTYDACRFEFDVIPSGDSLSFQFVLGSEEYNEWVGSQYNDVFGFFISGPGIAGDPGIGSDHNIALIPGTSTAVAINNVNAGQNSSYFQYNAGGQQLQFDGYTRNLVARSVVQPCQSYHLKLIVADASDRKFDSWVFIEQIQSPNLRLSSRTLNGSPEMVEGCNDGWIRFTRDPVLATPLTLQYYLQGTATNGTDYSAIGNVDPLVAKTITIPGGQAYAEQQVSPTADATAEPTEFLRVVLGNPYCSGAVIDSLLFNIVDTLIATVTPGNTTICLGNSVQFNVTGGSNYAWSPSTGLSCTDCPNPIASPTTTTNYSVVITDGTCARTVNRQVRVSNPQIASVVTQPLCNGQTNGAINITLSGGYGPYSHAWTGPNGFTASTEDLVNVAAGSYTVVATDAYGCSRTQGFNMGSPAELQLALTPSIMPFGQNIACNGASTGTLGLTITGGSGPYTTSWNGPNGFTSNNEDLSGIAAGAYTVAVSDANGCSASGGFTMTQSDVLQPATNGVQGVLCFGELTGSASASVAGGMPPYAYAWNSVPAQNTANATGLAAGSHTATITDGYGCAATANVNIPGPLAPLSATTTAQTNVLCFGNATGNATVAGNGGTGPYTYVWNTTPAQSGANATGLVAGTWTCTITDANACSTTRQVTITQPAIGLVGNVVSQTNVICFGATTGTAMVSVTGGTVPYAYQWNTVPVQSTASANGLPEGTWTCTITDGNGCTTTQSATISQPAAALNSTADAQTNVNCFGGSTGSATVSAFGGSAPYSYSWNTSPVQSAASATNLPAGTWTCTVTDASGCTTTRSFTITQPAAALSTSISSQTNVLCFGNSTGSASVNVTGGTAPYTYSWNTTSPQNTANASNLQAGTWTCTITDANGCSTTEPVVILQPSASLESSIGAQTNVACFGNATGSATAIAIGGTAPYSYSWDTAPVQSSSTAINMPAGTWTCTITDANSCSTQQSATITQPSAALGSNTASQSNVNCFGGTTGTATVSPNGGSAPYAFAWNTAPAQSGATAINLPAGTWTCTITDANGCSTAHPITISQPAAALGSALVLQANVNCFGNATGSATVNAIGGTSPYGYAWNTVPAQITAAGTNLLAGTWTCTITDANGCSTTLDATIAQPASALGSTLNALADVNCFGNATGSAAIAATGGTGPYSYSWNTSPVQTSASANNLIAGTWTCTISDANLCTTTRNVTIAEPVATLASTLAAQTDVNCFGNSTGSATVSVTGGTTPYAYDWNTAPAQTSSTATSLTSGTWTCVITDANGCTTSSTATISQPAQALSSSLDAQTNVTCFGASTGSASVNVLGGTAPYTYSWDTSPTQSGSAATSLSAGSWTCTVVDANGCSTAETASITQPAAELTLNGNTTPATCGGASNGAVDASISGGTSPYTIAWTGPGGFTSASSDITSLVSGVYTLSVTDANGCQASEVFNVNQPGLFTISGTTTDYNGFEVSCVGNSDGAIDQSISGGTAPYNHAWTGPNGYSAGTEDISALLAGTYVYTITDDNGCSTAANYDLSAPPALSASLTPTVVNGGWNIACNGSTTGAIDATVVGGLAPLIVSWSGPNGFASAAEDISGLVAGSYTLAIADGNGCVANTNQVLTEAPAINGTTSALADVSCNGGTNGQASVSAVGGTAPYSYDWSTTPTQSGPVAIDLSAGTHACTITDANGCTAIANAGIAEPAAPLVVEVTGFTNVLCQGSAQGTAQSLASGGTAPYAYSWSSTPAQLAANAVDLPAGTYTVTATDAQGCTASDDVTIDGPQFGLDGFFENVAHVTCFGAQDGSATVNVSGGSNSYTITWNTVPPTIGPTATNLAPGDYLVHVVDNNGCDHEKFYPLTILGPASPLVVDIAVNTITCANASDGSIDLTMSGGLGPYTHYWYDIDGDFTSQEDLNGLDPDTYTLQAHDALGCAYDTTIVMVEPPLLTVTAVTTPAECSGAANGAIDVTASGGTGAYTYMWFGPNNFFSTAEDLTAINAGNYHLVVTDANGCTRFNDPVVAQPGDLQIALTASNYNGSNTTCAGASDGSIDLEIMGGSGSYSAQWSGPNGFSSTDEDISGLIAGGYQVTVSDANGCSLAQSITLTAPALGQATLTLSNNNGYGVTCNGATDGSIDLALAGGTAPFTSAWSGPDGFASTDQDITALASGTYDVIITDANGCTTNASANIVAPTVLGSNLQVMLYPGGTQISCAAANDGAIDLSISGGVEPYGIAWTNGLGFTSADEDISALEAGGYQATITDANGCSTTAFATLTAPDPIGLSAQLSAMNGSNVSCDGATDGSIDLTMSGGTAPYAFAWDNGSTDEDLASIGAGTYTVTAVDANGCTMNTSYTLIAPGAFDIDLLGSAFPGGANISCNGATDGTIGSTINGGTAPYTLVWSGPGGFTTSTSDLSSIAAGDYELLVTDANGCSGNASISIAQPDPVVVEITSTTYNGNYNIPCAGLSIGQAIASATGGTPTYSYAWNGPNAFSSVDQGIISLSAGDFIATATDSNGCTGSASITLAEPEVLEVTMDIADLGGYPVSCNGNDGSASVVIDGGTPQFFISWTGPDGFTSTDANVSNMPAGDYALTVTDANGCSVQESFTLTAPEALSASFTYTANACATDLNGAIDLDFAGGAAPYVFAWSGPSGFTAATEDIAALATGAYTVQVTDTLGCIGTFNALLDGPAPINSGTYVSFYGLYNLQCLGDSTGAIDLTPTGGVTPFTVALSGPGSFSSTALVNDSLVAGDYLITITDQNGCSLDTTVTLTQPDTQVDAALTASMYPSGTNVSCFGASDGSIDATITGGNGPYTFDWRGPDSLAFSTEDITGLPAGTYAYELVVIDANQCAFATTITLTQPDSALAASSVVSDYNGYGVSCPNSTDGTISMSIIGGNGGYGVVWSGPNGFSSTVMNINTLIAGTYTATMTDMNGCTLVQDVIVSAPPAIDIALSALAYASGSNISCAGANDGSITAVVNGGTGNQSVTWTGPNGPISGGSTISGLIEGSYCLSVTDANGCTSQSCITLIAPELLTAASTPTDAACGQPTGSIDLLVNGGSAPYTYDWDNGSSTEDINGLAAGVYIVSVTDVNGCTTTSSGSIATTPGVDASAQVVNVLCNGSNTGQIDLSVVDGTAPFAYAWSNASTSEDLTAIGGGAYSVSVTDANGCGWTGTWTVTENDAITIDSTLSSYVSGDNVSAFGASDGSIAIVPQGGSAPYEVLWSTGATTNMINGLSAGTYTVTVTDSNGCILMSTFILTEPQDLEMPTGYTPNGDGSNDAFVIHGLDAYPANTFTVVNRWGNIVYDRLNYTNDWAGENSQGDLLPSGTYFVILNINKGERVLQSYVDLRR